MHFHPKNNDNCYAIEGGTNWNIVLIPLNPLTDNSLAASG